MRRDDVYNLLKSVGKTAWCAARGFYYPQRNAQTEKGRGLFFRNLYILLTAVLGQKLVIYTVFSGPTTTTIYISNY